MIRPPAYFPLRQQQIRITGEHDVIDLMFVADFDEAIIIARPCGIADLEPRHANSSPNRGKSGGC